MSVKKIILDSCTLISLASNCLLWVLRELKSKSDVEFVIPPGVKRETVDTALKSKKWRLEGTRLNALINEGVISIMYSKRIKDDALKLLNLANSIYIAKGSPMKIVHTADMEVVALANFFNSNTIATDEKTLRLLVEDPHGLKEHLSSKLHTDIILKEKELREFQKITGEMNVLRSIEIGLIGFEKEVFDNLIEKSKQSRKQFLSALLWSLKFSGCSISQKEIDEYQEIYFK